MKNIGYFLFIILYAFIGLALSKEMGISNYPFNITLLWFLFLIITFMFGVCFGNLSQENMQISNQAKKEQKLIAENLALLTDSQASSKDIESACWFIVNNKYSNKDNLFFIIKHTEKIKHAGNKKTELVDTILEKFKMIKEKSQDT